MLYLIGGVIMAYVGLNGNGMGNIILAVQGIFFINFALFIKIGNKQSINFK